MQTEALVNVLVTELNDLKAMNVTTLNTHRLSSITDFMIIATGNSSRHVQALTSHLIKKMKEQKITPMSKEGDPLHQWDLVDFGEVVVHIMQQNARDYYHLEKLWTSPSQKTTLS